MFKNKFVLLLTIWVFSGVFILSKAEDYKPYKPTQKTVNYFQISFNKSAFTVKVFDNEAVPQLQFDRSEISLKNGVVYADGKVLFDQNGLLFDGKTYEYHKISDTRVIEKKKVIQITFLTSEQSKTTKFKKGNLINYDENIIVAKEDFIRGFVFTINGDIEISGEVNKDVITLLGDIKINSDATIRGDVVSTNGHIEISKRANIYGKSFSVSSKRINRLSHRFKRQYKDFAFDTDLDYNRVDGFSIYGGIEFKDSDSLLPHFFGKIGYGFESERWRYKIGLEQAVLRKPSLTAGGVLYRELAAEDDWIIDKTENRVFVLLFTEDFKDYYEAEGGKAYLKYKPHPRFDIETGIDYRETKFLRAHRHIWSLFGGSKLFRYNYSTVPENLRTNWVSMLDTAKNVSWYNIIEFSQKDRSDFIGSSYWSALLVHEMSTGSLNSDFDYNRLLFRGFRKQSFNDYLSLEFTATMGITDDETPMEKLFYLGGIGTLRGYKNKEFLGTKFWMINADYKVEIPKSDFGFFVLWDAAKFTDNNFLFDTDVKHDIGIGLCIGDAFNITLSKRLDQSGNDDPIFYARFKSDF